MLMIHISNLRKLLNSGDSCNLKFWKKSGEIVHAQNVVCTSSFFKNDTVNIKFISSEEIRTVRLSSIFQFNNQEVCL